MSPTDGEGADKEDRPRGGADPDDREPRYDMSDLLPRLAEPQPPPPKPPGIATPEQFFVGCLLAVGVFIAAVVSVAVFWWYQMPEFHAK